MACVFLLSGIEVVPEAEAEAETGVGAEAGVQGEAEAGAEVLILLIVDLSGGLREAEHLEGLLFPAEILWLVDAEEA